MTAGIVGLGLIGGSLAKAYPEAGAAGVGPPPPTVPRATSYAKRAQQRAQAAKRPCQ